jgi:hypothetical protein
MFSQHDSKVIGGLAIGLVGIGAKVAGDLV